MFKRIFVLFIAIFLISSISLTKAYAKYLDTSEDTPLESPYMTLENSTDQKDTFGWDEEPWAFIGFDVTDLNTRGPLELTWSWYFDSELFVASESQRITSFLNDPLYIWNSLDNWDAYKQVGEWKTVLNWENRTMGGRGGWGSQEVNFTVTPEPASAILFLIGAAPMAIRYYRRKRKTA